MSKRIQLDEQAVIKMYREVDNARECAVKFGVSDQTIYRLLERNDIKRTGNRTKLKRERKPLLMDEKHVHMRELARRRYHAIANGTWQGRKVIDDEAILKLYSDGMNCREISDELEIDRSVVGRHLRRHGIKHKKGAMPPVKKACVFCGDAFETTSATQTSCPSCMKWKRNNSDFKSRAELYGVEYDSSVNLGAVLKRDGHVCYMCGKNLDAHDKRWGTFGPDYPTLDHVVPLSKGGGHTWDNVRAACAYCNCVVKGDRELKGS